MEAVAKEVFRIGTEKLDEYAYGYVYPKGGKRKWKRELEYVDPAGFDSIKAVAPLPHMRYNAGRRLMSAPFPRKLIKEGAKGEIADFEQTEGFMLVSESFRRVVEAVEPDVHQFEPVEIMWKDGGLAARMYVFVICTELDSVSAEHTDGIREEINFKLPDGRGTKIIPGPWMKTENETLRKAVFSLEAIQSHCLWQDGFFVGGPFCSDVFRNACEKAGVTGIVFSKQDAV